MEVIVLEGILKRIGVGQKDEKRDDRAIRQVCLEKFYHASFYQKKGGKEKPFPLSWILPNEISPYLRRDISSGIHCIKLRPGHTVNSCYIKSRQCASCNSHPIRGGHTRRRPVSVRQQIRCN